MRKISKVTLPNEVVEAPVRFAIASVKCRELWDALKYPGATYPCTTNEVVLRFPNPAHSQEEIKKRNKEFREMVMKNIAEGKIGEELAKKLGESLR